MSRSIALVAAGTPLAGLSAFASTLVSKASGNAATLAAKAAEPRTVAVAVGPEAPAGTHTAVTQLDAAHNASSLYKGVKTVFVRSVLPRAAEEPLSLRDALDVLPNAGINSDAEVAAAKAAMQKTASVAVALAKQKGASKITILTKQSSKYTQLNALWNETLTEAAAASGTAVDIVLNAAGANQLIMTPENLGVVVAADTPSAELVEAAFAGILGGVERTYHTESGATVVGGNSVSSVANAVAAAFRAQGLTAEAKKIADAVAKAPADSAALLAAL